MLQREHPAILLTSIKLPEHPAILLTSIKLPVVIKTFVLAIIKWLFYTGFIVLSIIFDSNTYYKSFCSNDGFTQACNRISMELPILYVKRSQVYLSEL